MKWTWTNTTQVGFGTDCVKEHLHQFVEAGSRVLCTFGGGSIDRNGARQDVTEALAALNCEVKWEGGILANPEYDHLLEIVAVVKSFKPDILIAVGGGSVLDGTKFISCAAMLEEGVDPWTILSEGNYPSKAIPVGAVMTLPATGSEWNWNLVISRKSINAKIASASQITFPKFSLLDPKYTMTLPPRQLQNGVFDAITHCMDQYLTGEENSLFDNFFLTVVKELVNIGPEVIQENSSLELHERLIVAASFGLNIVFSLGKDPCWGIHDIGNQLTAKFHIDHGRTLSIVAPFFFENQFESRIPLLAKSAEYVFGVNEGSQEEKARAFISELRAFIKKIGMPEKVSDVEGVVVNNGDLEQMIKMVWEANGSKPFGWRGQVTEDNLRAILTQCIK